MERAAIDVGRVRVTAFLDGAADRDPITQSFPGVPPEALLAYRDRHPGVYGEGDAWRLIVRAWLVEHPGGLTLVDTGVGIADWFPAPGRLIGLLTGSGMAATDIGSVVLSHVHDDHIGGTVTGAGEPAFPNARYVIQTADLAAQRAWASRDEEDRDIWERLLLPLQRAGVLDEVDGDVDLTELIRLRLAPGHTPGHQIVHVRDAHAHLVITADTWNHPIQLAHPEWPSGHDHDPERAAQTRRALLPEMLAEPPILAPTHFADAFGSIVTGTDDEPEWRSHVT